MDEKVVQTKSFEFALNIIRLYKKLQARQEFVLANELLRSGTQIGSSVEEAFAGPTQTSALEIAVAAKAVRATGYWLRLLQASRLADIDVSQELHQLEELRILLEQFMAVPR
ncbi:MAG: four helix bundle protein [Elainella sp. Prado103]|jgi:four helix bundle protein|nr:four helix bundle protein [Elainella sp. Prado103]